MSIPKVVSAAIGALFLTGCARVATGPGSVRAPEHVTLEVRDAVLVLDLEASVREIAAVEKGLLGKEWDPRKVAGSYPSRVRFSPDGKLIAVGLHAKEVRVFDAGSGKLAGWGPSPHLPIFWHIALAWSRDGERLFTGGGDHVVWEFRRAKKFNSGERGFRPVEVWTYDLDSDPAGRYLAAATKDGQLMIWDINGKPLDRGAYGYPDVPPERVWKEPRSGNPKRRLPFHGVAWSPDGRFIIAGGLTGLRLFRAREKEGGELASTGKALPYPGKPEAAYRKRIWEARKILELPHERLIEDLDEEDRRRNVLAVDWSPDGALVVACQGGWRRSRPSDRNPVKIWRTADWTPMVLDSFSPRPYAARFSPDGAMLAVGGGRGVRVYRVSDWARVVTISGFRDEVNSVDWSPDGARLAACAGGERTDRHGAPFQGYDPVGKDPFVYVFQIR